MILRVPNSRNRSDIFQRDANLINSASTSTDSRVATVDWFSGRLYQFIKGVRR